jgi:hypothetical protein
VATRAGTAGKGKREAGKAVKPRKAR